MNKDKIKPILTPNIRNRIIGWIIKNHEFYDFKNRKKDNISGYNFQLATDIRNKWLWDIYGDVTDDVDDDNENMHPDEASILWLKEIYDYINSDEFNLKNFINTFPEELI